METTAITVASYAKTNDDTWPFQTFPHYEEVVSQFRDVSGTGVLALAPILDRFNEQWEIYSVENQGWLDESYKTIGWDVEPYPIQGAVWEIDDSGLTVQSTEAVTLPLWQRSEPPKDTSIINFNLLSDERVATTFQPVLEHHYGEIGPIMDMTAIVGSNNEESESFANANDTPESLFLQPVLELEDEGLSFAELHERSEVKAAIVASLLWDDFYSGLYHDTEGGDGMVVVTEVTCQGQDDAIVFSYALHGTSPEYLGFGDHHNPKYESLVHHAYLDDHSHADNSDHHIHNEVEPVCVYSLRIYPSAQVEAQNTTNEPIIFTMVMVMLFVATAIGFVVYDFFVQRRQRNATADLLKSTAIVSSLFPAEIRDRLLQDEEDKQKNKRSSLDDVGGTQKFRLQNFLDEEGEEAEKNKAANKKGDGVILDSKPIADLFPNTTVLFADIAGFTAWSSVREPSQVFTLLETVYKAFDKTAKRRK
ncbi:MAG: hypothetical protein SGARI_001271, partial [Bacillariaceae sp.]